MQKFHLDSLFAFFPTSFRKAAVVSLNPNLVWKVIITLAVLATIFSAISAVYFYQWVSISGGGVVTNKPEKDTLSVGEIRAVVDIYKAKQTHFQELLLTRPIAPALGKDSGVTVVSDVPSGDILNMESVGTISAAPVP